MAAAVKNFLEKLSNYPRLRVALIIGVVVIVFLTVMNLLTPKETTTPPSSVQPVSANPNAKTQTVSQQAANQYNKLANTAQQQEIQQAATTGETVFENPFSNDQKASSSQTPTEHKPTTSLNPQQFANQQVQQPQAATSPNTSPPPNPQAQALQQQLNQLQQQLANQQQMAQNNAESQVESSMRSSADSLASTWALPQATTVSAEASSKNAASSGAKLPGPVIIKAGTIYYGVIQTSLNSDQPGTPVMAKIVNGPYNGAVLLGAFQRENDALVVQFSRMTLPNMSSTIGINAYAIDGITADNAIATSVDNHYLLRYGMLFASSFLQGFGNAYLNYNYTCPPGTANCTLIDSNGTPNTQATATTATYQGLGQIGTNLGQAAGNVFNTPVTVKVAQGTGVGLLFMDNVSLPNQ